MKTMDFYTVDKVYSQIINNNIGKFIKNNNVDINVKLKHQGEVLHLKLEKELDIRNFIRSVEHVDDYKTILKSVKILEEKVSKAQNQDVDLDPELMKEVNKTTFRLTSERNLRFQMEMVKVP